MSNFVKATVRKLAELPWPDFRDIFSWPGSSTINAENPHLLVAKAADENGEVVAYVTAEPILLVDGYVVNPERSGFDTSREGDAIEQALAETAKIERLWMLIPDEAPPMPGERVIRLYERRVYQPVTTQRHGFGETNQQQAQFQN